MPATQNICGLKVGRLTVVARGDKDNFGQYFWICKCECGKDCRVRTATLTGGRQLSCGCLLQEHYRTWIKHGHKRTTYTSPEFNAFVNARQRCNNPRNKAFKDYGGRAK